MLFLAFRCWVESMRFKGRVSETVMYELLKMVSSSSPLQSVKEAQKLVGTDFSMPVWELGS